MPEVLVDDLLVRFLAEVPAGDKTDALGLLRIAAAALRDPVGMADALERAIARLEGAPRG